jgi:tetratricopeptide (TPR) repeat protein
MRTLPVLLFALLLPFGLYGHMAGAPGPGGGLPEVGEGARWWTMAALGGAGALLAGWLGSLSGSRGVGLAVALGWASHGSLADLVGGGDPREVLRFLQPLAVLVLAALIHLRWRGGDLRLLLGAPVKEAGSGGPLTLPMVGIAALLVLAFGAEPLDRLVRSTDRAAAALRPDPLGWGPFALAAVLGMLGLGVFRAGASTGSRRGAALVLLLLLPAVAVVLGHRRAASWETPAAFWGRAIEAAPRSPAALGAGARVAAEAGDLALARERLRTFAEACAEGRGADLRPDARALAAEGAARAAARLLAAKGPGDAALADGALAGARALAPGSAAVLAAAGEGRLAAGDFAEAARLLDESLALDPGSADAWDALARARLEGSLLPEAHAAALRATGLLPTERRFVVTFARTLLGLGRGGEALEALSGILPAAGPRDPEAARAFADVEARLARDEISSGRRGRAWRMAGAGLQADPGHLECMAIFADIDAAFRRERPAAEERWMRPRPDGTRDPNDVTLFAVWLCRWGRFEEAAPIFNDLLAKLDAAALHFQVASEFWEARGTVEGTREAVRAYRDALVRDPGLVEARARLWNCLRLLGEAAAARAEAAEFVRRAPAHPDAADAEAFLRGAGGAGR